MSVDSSATAAGYSAEVRLRLHVNGRTIRLAQIGPDFIMPAEPAEIPPGPAEVVMIVDGAERRWSIFLPESARSRSGRIPTQPRSPAAPVAAR